MKFLISAGGTGGHITPGIAIGQMLKNEGHDVIFIGTKYGMEKDLVPKAGFSIKYIHASGLNPGIANKVKALSDLRLGIKDCKKIIEEEKPDMCIGTVGYVTAPLMISAKKLKVPTLIHESNALPGKTTRLMARSVNKVAVGFKEAKDKLNLDNVVVTGNPNKMALNDLTKEEAKNKIGINGKLLLIFGGSQGAKRINEVIIESINKEYLKGYNVIYSTGPKNYEEAKNSILEKCKDKYEIINNEDSLELYFKEENNTSFTYTSKNEGINKDVKTIDSSFINQSTKIIIKKFIYNMEEVLKAADLVVSRSGALTCTEIAEVGVASILIPFPYAAENHQLYNAKTLENAKAGIIIEEKNLSEEILVKGINEIINDDNLIFSMGENAKKLKVGNPIVNIKNEIFNILKDK